MNGYARHIPPAPRHSILDEKKIHWHQFVKLQFQVHSTLLFKQTFLNFFLNYYILFKLNPWPEILEIPFFVGGGGIFEHN